MAPHIEFHLVLFALSLTNFIVCYIWEVFFIQYVLFELVQPRLRRLRGPVHKYEKLEKELLARPDWPPIGGSSAGGEYPETVLNVETQQPSTPGFAPGQTSEAEERLTLEAVPENEDELDLGLTRRDSEYRRWLRNQGLTKHGLSLKVASDENQLLEQSRMAMTTFGDGSHHISRGQHRIDDSFI